MIGGSVLDCFGALDVDINVSLKNSILVCVGKHQVDV